LRGRPAEDETVARGEDGGGQDGGGQDGGGQDGQQADQYETHVRVLLLTDGLSPRAALPALPSSPSGGDTVGQNDAAGVTDTGGRRRALLARDRRGNSHAPRSTGAAPQAGCVPGSSFAGRGGAGSVGSVAGSVAGSCTGRADGAAAVVASPV